MRIDTHAHVYPSDYLDFLADSGVATTGGQRGLGADDTDKDLEVRFSLMERAGVDRQVISASPLTGALPDPERAATAARMINDRYVTLVDRHPDHFLAFVVLPLPHVDAALAELDRVLDAPGVMGVALTTSAAGRALTDPAFAPVWQELDRRGTVMYLHPAGDGVASPQITDHHLTWMVGAPVEDTVVAAQLITRGFVTRYPHVRILNSHFGGALPMLLERWDNLAHFEAPEAPLPPSQAARRMWYDTVAHSSQTALRAAVQAVGADRLVLGSDFPYQSGEHYLDTVAYIERAGLDAEDTQAVLAGNAEALLGLA
ncbi:amidohydrolase family protein [Streptomyces sp. AK08-02]|uniref:amidohydrolase family protein n=1 Tax=Streptomyces sp. AK08-02 TaxID=3028654 RepID=UPI0029AC199C|nr:amidohydrolase family protein [Streptomyces sp. AK08-02]MDX3748501.1 amidohydrolase family protein [Streptomyces sp. AK08-02]